MFNLTAKIEEIRLRRTTNNLSKAFVVGQYASAITRYESFKGEHDKKNKKLVLSSGNNIFGNSIDISWLPAASETYKVSADPRDYILSEIPLVTIDIPNRNLQAFPYEEVSYFDPLLGRLVYSTFIGKPTHQDHDNKNPLKAKGINFDATMRFIPQYGVWKIFVLAGYDRTKDSYLANKILTGERNSFSMGALVDSFVCSYCGTIDTNIKKCACMRKGKGAVINGSLVYQLCVGANFIECSSVLEPADITAEGILL